MSGIMFRMGLRVFESSDAVLVAGWPASAAEVQQWCTRAEVSAEVVAGWAGQADVVAYGLVEDEELIGYGELWIDHDESEVELARLIVPPARRGVGIGRRLVAGLVREASRHYPAIFMRVHPENAAALRCYAGAGFAPVSPAEADEWNRSQSLAYVWLRFT